VIAVGATELVPPIPGLDLPHVMTGNEAILREAELGERVVVVGAGAIGTEIGLELARLRGTDVTMVDIGATYAPQGNTLYREALRQKIEDTPGLSFRLRSRCLRVEPDAVVVADAEGVEHRLPADHVVISVGMRPRADLAAAFYGITPETVTVGDAVRPRIIMDAVFEGHTYAMNL
jgi:pyruvate/2-oxoglutarate dehydrogenase complex dihydrolipoamide dehydrogenase (E3) component